MNVLNVITDSNIGGAGLVLVNYYKAADRTKFTHTVVVPRGSLLTERLRALDITVIELPDIGESSLNPRAISAFRRVMCETRPDIVHTHASMSARIAARLYGKCKIVYTRHCAYPQSRAKTTFPLKQALGFVNNRLSDRVIAISPAARDNLTDTGTEPRRITVMFNGVERVRTVTDEEKAVAQREYGIADGDFVVVMAARFVAEKGHAYALDAAARLRGLPIKIVLAGMGPTADEMKSDAAARELTNIVFAGFVSDLAPLYNIADAQLNCSYGTETSSLALLEGMSVGLPSVATDFGGNPFIVEDGVNGIIVQQRDGAAIADAISRIYGDAELRKRLGDGARDAYASRFTCEIMARNIERVYEDAARVGKGS
ncbi:MAG: glycosyltransferase family 4 protein [Oscillospiraceae bacterium]|nr:glycosyltransferase family 4 protein [Oscillospiraceae bacterium]